jgi:hypothetical protein
MARTLSTTHSGSDVPQLRVPGIIIRGEPDAPFGQHAEYVVSNDGSLEPRKALEKETPNFNQTVTALCESAIDDIETAEGL